MQTNIIYTTKSSKNFKTILISLFILNSKFSILHKVLTIKQETGVFNALKFRIAGSTANEPPIHKKLKMKRKKRNTKFTFSKISL